MLFLEADEETLLDRYKETRRRHPLAPEGARSDGHPRRARAARAAARARRRRDRHHRADRGVLRRRIAERDAGRRDAAGKLAVTLLTFGFKNGPPRDADLRFDVRFLPNPHYVPELRPLTGLDQEVRDYVDRRRRARRVLRRLLPLLEFLLPAYVAEGKTHLTIAIGCTGGRHRSVAIAEHLGPALPRAQDYIVEVAAPRHRPAPAPYGSEPRSATGQALSGDRRAWRC